MRMKNMVSIIIEKGENNWMAYTKNNDEKIDNLGIGKTCKEAVGDLILKNLTIFDVQINAIT